MKTPASVVALAALSLLCGCSSQSQNSAYGQYFTLMRQALRESWGDGGVTRDQAAAIPYASIGYRVNDSREAILVLATDNGGEQMWTSASRIVLVTRDGRVIRTVGLPHDLTALTPAGNAASLPSPADALQGPVSITATLDFADRGTYGATMQCRARAAARETIRILGNAMVTTRVDEDCSVAAPLNWRFRNSYWVEARTRFVWRTRQQIHPKDGTLDVEILRPPG